MLFVNLQGVTTALRCSLELPFWIVVRLDEAAALLVLYTDSVLPIWSSCWQKVGVWRVRLGGGAGIQKEQISQLSSFKANLERCGYYSRLVCKERTPSWTKGKLTKRKVRSAVGPEK